MPRCGEERPSARRLALRAPNDVALILYSPHHDTRSMTTIYQSDISVKRFGIFILGFLQMGRIDSGLRTKAAAERFRDVPAVVYIKPLWENNWVSHSTTTGGRLMSQNGFTIWLTGLSGAGKTTLARIMEARLKQRGLKVEVLDGDIIRTNLSKGLGFSKEDRDTNIRRIGFVCNLLSRNEVVAIAAAISPYREIRDELRQQIGAFVEVYAHCPIDVLADRDVKGLYKKALAGEIKHFTGVDDPYEEPYSPEVVVNTDVELPEESAAKILAKLEQLGYIAGSATESYTEEDEEEVRRRLESLGYV